MANRRIFYLLICFLVTLFSGLVYGAVGQSLRLLADDPQVQITQDILSSLGQGADPKQLSATVSDISTTMTPYVIIYDNNEKVLGSTIELDKKTPVPPKGVFEKAKKYNENRFTWEPKKGLRQAAVMVKYKDGFVLSGKTLKEVENRTKIIFKLVGVAWVIGIAATSMAFLLTRSKNEVIKETEISSPKKSSRKVKK